VSECLLVVGPVQHQSVSQSVIGSGSLQFDQAAASLLNAAWPRVVSKLISQGIMRLKTMDLVCQCVIRSEAEQGHSAYRLGCKSETKIRDFEKMSGASSVR
jgi:hypothetical protein